MAEAKKKLQLALYWAASCGGCDVATLDVNEKILDIAAMADIRLWPIAMDFKYKDIDTWATARSTSASSTARCATASSCTWRASCGGSPR